MLIKQGTQCPGRVHIHIYSLNYMPAVSFLKRPCLSPSQSGDKQYLHILTKDHVSITVWCRKDSDDDDDDDTFLMTFFNLLLVNL